MITKKNAQKLNKLMCKLNPGKELYHKAVMANIDGREMQSMYLNFFIIGLYERNEFIETSNDLDVANIVETYLTSKLPDEYDQISFDVEDIKAAINEYKERRTANMPLSCAVELNRKFYDAEYVLDILDVLTKRGGKLWWCQTTDIRRADYIETDNGIAVFCPMSQGAGDRAIHIPTKIIDEVRKC